MFTHLSLRRHRLGSPYLHTHSGLSCFKCFHRQSCASSFSHSTQFALCMPVRSQFWALVQSQVSSTEYTEFGHMGRTSPSLVFARLPIPGQKSNESTAKPAYHVRNVRGGD